MKGDSMIDTLFSIITDENLREPATVEMQLAEQTSAGVPWFDEA